MKIKQPQPFTFEAGPRAVLLLHGFTGHTADVRMLGRFLEKKGYTSHGPIYRGHGLPPEELIKTNPDQYWEDVQASLQHLRDLGYEEIAVAGLSLGGVYALKLAYTTQLKAVIPMCAPMFYLDEASLAKGFKSFTRQYKQIAGVNEEQLDDQVNDLYEKGKGLFSLMGQTITDVRENVDTIYTPTFVVQARKDEMINTDSADYIYDHVEADKKQIKWYEESGHVITLDKEKEKLHDDIYQFLETLDWKE
ncbi:carboxylesterase [Oceanobacillus arenosus]|uniref:Carboxylesterase n=1 Tax=Oceanobacillus arenosus TaxID=1229153 RepID=A0A3D8PM41_9BACI|nr:alpha/beta fold hydrolase [Oceanobacillus arenosus]RDW16577.1 carboxylesterase [Oceanobacillus arenosus]